MSYQLTQTGAEIQALLNSISSKYEKPLTGIPKTDLASGVQSSLDLADSALQSVPDLDASKITSGTFSTSRIPSLSASKITSGTFADARIPSLSASKITSGTFADSRIASASTWNAKYTKPSSGIPDSDIASASTWNGKYTKPSGGIPDSDIASASTWNGKANVVKFSNIQVSTTWTEDATAGWFTQTIAVSGIQASDTPIADVDLSALTSQSAIDTALTDWALIFRISCSADSITLYASSGTSASLNMTLEVVR